MTVITNLKQDGAEVTGDFDVMEVMYSGGYVRGTVSPGTTTEPFGTFKANFFPDDLGVPFDITTTIPAEDGGTFTGTFVFSRLGSGKVTFTRVK